jgi:hypothetical protein
MHATRGCCVIRVDVENDLLEFEPEPPRTDARQDEAAEELRRIFAAHPRRVFFSRQLEVWLEDRWFHWITNRALRALADDGVVRTETRELKTGGRIHLVWPSRYRYHRREAKRVVDLVEEYAAPNIGAALGLHAELLILEGFAKKQFITQGRNTRTFREVSWSESDHELDFIFERDGVPYGVEVKNTLGYMPRDELVTKVKMCEVLGLKPVFVVRMLPKTWIQEVVAAGGFVLILKWQLYPLTHGGLARRVREELNLPVDSPRALEDGTVARFVRWHEQRAARE